MPTIGLLLGSTRENANHPGLHLWLSSLLPASSPPLTLLTPPSLGPLLDPIVPQGITSPSQYAALTTQAWSQTVAATDAFVILTPQYNWGIPGGLKNDLDHLWSEWRGKPVWIVTYGGHGGGKCAAHLRDVLGGGLRMKVVGGVEVTLPEMFIKGKERVTGGEE